jgi:hypothetical protein
MPSTEDVPAILEEAEAPIPTPKEAGERRRDELLASLPSPKHIWIPAKEMRLDEELNPLEELSQRVAIFYAANFLWPLAHGWHVSPRGKWFDILDGRHRWWALRENRELHRKVGCYVHEGLSPEQKAALKGFLNQYRRTVSIPERFHTMVLAGDPATLSVKRVLDETGIRTNAYASLLRIIDGAPDLDQGELALRWTLGTLEQTFPGEEGRFHQLLLGGLGRFWNAYNTHAHFDVSDFPERVRRGRKTAKQIVGSAAEAKSSTGTAAQRWVLNYFVQRHDANRRYRLIPVPRKEDPDMGAADL